MPGSTESGLASQSQVGGGRGTSKFVECPRVEVEEHKYDCRKLAHVLIWSSRGLQKLPRVLVWSSQAPPRAGTRSRLAVSHTGKFILVSVCVCVRARGAWSSEISAEMILYCYIKKENHFIVFCFFRLGVFCSG